MAVLQGGSLRTGQSSRSRFYSTTWEEFELAESRSDFLCSLRFQTRIASTGKHKRKKTGIKERNRKGLLVAFCPKSTTGDRYALLSPVVSYSPTLLLSTLPSNRRALAKEGSRSCCPLLFCSAFPTK